MSAWLAVIGIGEDGLAGLSAAARALIDAAELVVGGDRHLALVGETKGERLPWRQPLADTIALIAARRGKPVAVLASGDPLQHGIGATLARHFPAA
jgi:precorrin-6B C5,15-methyltransferase / cobalt-precorrin-6B C5,C15-methyltransferase